MDATPSNFQTQALKQLAQVFATIPFNKLLGMELQELSFERSIISFKMQDQLVGNYAHGILHGGVISSVLDMVGGMVAMASVIKKQDPHKEIIFQEIFAKTSTIDL